MFNKIGKIKLMPPVSWFNIKQLANTAIQSVISKIVSKQADRRLLLALASSEKEYYDYSKLYNTENGKLNEVKNSLRNEIWIDYIADTGDGWNATYSIAFYSSKPELNLKHLNNEYNTKRGDILIFGGDEVYPYPTKEAYLNRLTIPFEQALGDDKSDCKQHVFAIPGNHDWYDGLEEFTKLFCSDIDSRNFAGRMTRQKRSYFALKLPNNWWLFGSDGQLHSNIDTAQLEYFRYITENYIQSGDKIILCISEPVWIYSHKYKKYSSEFDETDLIFLEEKILKPKGAKVKLFLSGDLHHYRRHEEIQSADTESKVNKITAGGGGAFLHPTHGDDYSVITEDKHLENQQPRSFELKKSYPDEKTSKKLGWKILLFPFLNPSFGLVTAMLYLFTIWIVSSTFHFSFADNVWGFLDQTMKAFILNPVAALWLISVAAAFVFFTDTHSRFYKWAGGLTHFFLNLISIAYIGLFAAYINNEFFNENIYTGFTFIPLIIFVLGWFFGSFNMGLYLTISMNIFGRHDNEAFSAIRVQDYKNFLRLHIDNSGNLTIYPIKIEKVSRNWRLRNSGERETGFIIPEGGTKPELIEEPIIIKNK